MKNFFKITLIFILGLIMSCSQEKPKSGYSTQWSPDGRDSIVRVQYVNSDNSTSSFFMNYLLFRTLFGNGGYGNVYNYYRSHPSYFTHSSQRYYTNTAYSTDYNPKLKNNVSNRLVSYGTGRPVYKSSYTSSPSRSGFKSSPSRSSSPSYRSSPSRSSSPSYRSSPSRSYRSSPSRR